MDGKDPAESDLCEAAIHKQFSPCDVTAVIACEKHYGLRYLIACGDIQNALMPGSGLADRRR
jgi:hypothetical protein